MARDEQRRSWPWTRLLLATAICGPAFAIGGVPAWVLPGFIGVLLLAAARTWTVAEPGLDLPWLAALLGVAAGITAAQALPLSGIRAWVAPGLSERVAWALSGTGIDPPPGLSIVPEQTAYEAARVAALAVLCILATQVPWRWIAGWLTIAGAAVAGLGLLHGLAGTSAIYGVYEARDVSRELVPALLGTFVNANHQSGFLLLGCLCSVATAVDRERMAHDPREVALFDVRRDQAMAAWAATLLQVIALVLSLSRAAILVFAATLPFATWWVVRGLRTIPSRMAAGSARNVWTVRATWGLVALGAVAMAAQHGAVRELRSLSNWEQSIAKLHAARESLAMLELSPLLGIGRGGFVDLFGAYESTPSHVVMTHVESIPIAAVLEWGPWLGGALVLATCIWWCATMWAAGGQPDSAARRLAVLGIGAVFAHNLADFSLEFLGVAAPIVALGGALSPTLARRPDDGASPPRSRSRLRSVWARLASRPRVTSPPVLGAVLFAALGTSWRARPHSWAERVERDRQAARGSLSPSASLTHRPLDGHVHLMIARDLAERGAWEEATHRAQIAIAQRPGSIDGWLLLAAAAHRRGVEIERDVAMRRALELVHEPPSSEFAAYTIQLYASTPEVLAHLVPIQIPNVWRWLVFAWHDTAPEHADALARRVAEQRPTDPEPLLLRSSIALRRGRPELALYHARLARGRDPDSGRTHLAVATALAASPPGRRDEAIDELENALDQVSDPIERAQLEERLVRLLITRDDRASLERAARWVRGLPELPAPTPIRRARARLAVEVKRRRAELDRSVAE